MTAANRAGRRKRWVVKVGGSLSKSGDLANALKAIESLTQSGYRMVVSPGGGAYADFIRKRQKQKRLDNKTAHAQAILSVSQYGLELASLLKTGVVTVSRREASRALAQGATPVYLPDESLTDKVGAPPGWSTTSDTIAAAICKRMGFGGLILLKSVDGVTVKGRVVESSSAAGAARAGLVDSVFPTVILPSWEVYLLNGAKPGRLKSLVVDGRLEGTRLVN